MARKQRTRAELQAAVDDIPKIEDSLYVALRTLRRIDPIALHDASDFITEAGDEDSGDGYRYVTYGFRTPHSIDCVTVEFSAENGRTHVYTRTADMLITDWSAEGQPLAWRITAERVRGWLFDPQATRRSA